MGIEHSSQKGFFITILVLVGVMIAASYFQPDVVGDVVVRRPVSAPESSPKCDTFNEECTSLGLTITGTSTDIFLKETDAQQSALEQCESQRILAMNSHTLCMVNRLIPNIKRCRAAGCIATTKDNSNSDSRHCTIDKCFHYTVDGRVCIYEYIVDADEEYVSSDRSRRLKRQLVGCSSVPVGEPIEVGWRCGAMDGQYSVRLICSPKPTPVQIR